MAERVVITGPTGAIGMALIYKCLEEGCEVLAICHPGSARNQYIPQNPKVTIIEADMDDYRKLDLFKDRDYNIFYHLAWNGTFGADRNNMLMQIKNIENSLHSVKLAAYLGCETYIGVGSQAEYGRTEGMLKEDTPTFPETGYGIAKLCACRTTREVSQSLGMRHVWVRVLSVYGPYDRGETMISSALTRMMANEETAFTPGEQLWDYLYSEDAADALFQIGRHPVSGKTYCLGSGHAQKLKEYIHQMQEETGCRAEVKLGAMEYAPNQVMYLCADISELTKDTGFVPQTDFRTGIRKTIEWKKQHEKN